MVEETLLFLFVAFGDFRNQVEAFSSSSECPTLGQGQVFSCPFPPFDISKSFKITKLILAVNGQTVPNKMK